MQEHPVPQNITSYEFHLIGNMTLKQFFELAAGGLFAFMTYTSNLPDVIKWPLVFLFVILGVAFAFIPLEERPLDHWFLAFIRAIYNPTKFYWKKSVAVPEVFSFERGTQQNNQDEVVDALPRKRQRAQAYFQSISPSQNESVDEFDQQATSLLSLFDTTVVRDVVAKPLPSAVEKPDLMAGPHELHGQNISLPPTMEELAAQDVIAPQTEQPTPSQQFEVVYTAPVNIPPEDNASMVPTPPTTVFESSKEELPTDAGQYVEQNQNAAQQKSTIEAKTNNKLPFPKTPTTPNLVVGMVLDTDGKMIEQSIIEIRDRTGMPVRALRSNKLGQFFISTPLPSGEYELAIEKDGYTFDTMMLKLTGSIVPPLEIRAKAS